MTQSLFNRPKERHMDATLFQESTFLRPSSLLQPLRDGRVVNALEFEGLLVSHRRMVRADRRIDKLRGLQDLDTGELFLTDERRLVETRR
jgi:hypothetical protein